MVRVRGGSKELSLHIFRSPRLPSSFHLWMEDGVSSPSALYKDVKTIKNVNDEYGSSFHSHSLTDREKISKGCLYSCPDLMVLKPPFLS